MGLFIPTAFPCQPRVRRYCSNSSSPRFAGARKHYTEVQVLRDGKPSVAAAAGEAVRRLAGAVCGALGRAAAAAAAASGAVEAAAERRVVVVAAEVLPAVVAGIGCLQWRSQLLAAALSVVADWCASPSIGEASLLGMMLIHVQCSMGTFRRFTSTMCTCCAHALLPSPVHWQQ